MTGARQCTRCSGQWSLSREQRLQKDEEEFGGTGWILRKTLCIGRSSISGITNKGDRMLDEGLDEGEALCAAAAKFFASKRRIVATDLLHSMLLRYILLSQFWSCLIVNSNSGNIG
jgi:hypothetical protein